MTKHIIQRIQAYKGHRSFKLFAVVEIDLGFSDFGRTAEVLGWDVVKTSDYPQALEDRVYEMLDLIVGAIPQDELFEAAMQENDNHAEELKIAAAGCRHEDTDTRDFMGR